MKKPLIITLFLVFGNTISKAQITINSSNLSSIGDKTIQVTDKINTNLSIGTQGANKTWDFSDLSEGEIDTILSFDPSNVELQGDIGQNLVEMRTSNDSAWSFINKSNSEFKHLAFANIYNKNIFVTFDPTTVITFPSNYGTTYERIWDGESILAEYLGEDLDGTGVIDSIKATTYKSTSSKIDAWGQMTTPLGVFSVIRQTVAVYRSTTLFTYKDGVWKKISVDAAWELGTEPVVSGSYNMVRWWSNDENCSRPLVEGRYDKNTNVMYERIYWSKVAPHTASIRNIDISANYKSYPNPVTNTLTIKSESTDNASIDITNISSQVVKTLEFRNTKTTISTADLPEGLYFYSVYNQDHHKLYSNKFVIAR